MNNLHLAGISGSLRKDSFNTKLLKAAVDLLPAETTMDILSFADIPLYNADLDKPVAPARPYAVQQFRDELAKADGLLIVSPEYNYSMPGGLKNALDWASRGEDSPLLHKPVAIMGATPGLWGTVRMQMAFQAFFLYLDMKPVYKPEVLVAQAHKKFDKNGKLIDARTSKLISEKLQTLKEMIFHQAEIYQ